MKTSDDWYIDGVRAVDNVRRVEREQHESAAREQLQSVEAQDAYRHYDLAEMHASGIALDGRASNQYAKPDARLIGRRDARTAKPIADPSYDDPELYPPIGEVNEGAAREALRASAETVAAAVYETARGVWNFAADVDNVVLGKSVPLMPTYTEAGGSEPVTFGDALMRDMAGYMVGFAKAHKVLRQFLPGPMSTGMAAGAATDMVLTDPREGGFYDVIVQHFLAEHDLALGAGIAATAENNPLQARGALALEGAVIGTLAEGGMRALRKMGEGGKRIARHLFTAADNVEETAVQGLAGASHMAGQGLDADGQNWLTVWMGAQMMKGQTVFDDRMMSAVADSGATPEQIQDAWNAAARVTQAARRDAVEQWASRVEARMQRAP